MLQAVAPIELLRPHRLADSCWTELTSSFVAVVEGLSQQPAAAQERVVHCPCVHANTGQLTACRGCLKSRQNLTMQFVDIPMQPVIMTDRVIRKPRSRPERQGVGSDLADHHPAAGGAEVDGREAPRP
jgi:hypothetical protein